MAGGGLFQNADFAHDIGRSARPAGARVPFRARNLMAGDLQTSHRHGRSAVSANRAFTGIDRGGGRDSNDLARPRAVSPGTLRLAWPAVYDVEVPVHGDRRRAAPARIGSPE